MDWMQLVTLLSGFFALIFTNLGMFLWSRSESRANEQRALDLIEAIKQDIKDFHGRLCSIESKHRK